jgi:two-component system sensor histidine kinase/response regulator
MFTKERLKSCPAYVVDLGMIALTTIVVYSISNHFDIYDFLHDQISKYNHIASRYDLQLDELMVVAIILVPALGIFAWRRWSEVNTLLTERERDLSEVRAAKEQADSANRTKGEFLANMSHEIRTPMNAIMGMTDLVLDSDLNDEQRENLEIVKTSSQSLLQIINDILDFSKIEAGKLELASTEFSLGKALHDTVKSLSVRAHEKHLELACRVAPGTPDALIGDPLRLRQVLVNLVGNAIKFTQQGEIVVSAESETLDDGQLRVHFAVRDTGLGIPPEQQDRIFEAFTQVDGSSTRRFGGTGLGLAISTRLVALMGGHIWLDSAIGKGSTFHFTATFRSDTENKLSKPARRVELAGMRVLIADDNATNRLILDEAVSGWHMIATCVDGGASALEAMRSAAKLGKPFQLVLLDMMMPEMDGFDVVRHCKADPVVAEATIIMLSSADADSDAARCRELGITRYLRKPVSVSELYDAVTAAFTAESTKTELIHRPVVHAVENATRWNILLAEDNVVNQKVAVSILQKKGHSVQAVSNGKEALAALACERFDLVLMDVQMPEMDGLAATRAIRCGEQLTGQHIPIIAMTAHAMKGDRERCLDSGMDDYLAKPVEPKTLREIVDSWGSRSRTGNPRPQASDAYEPCPQPAPPQATDVVESEVFDFAGLQARVENDLELFNEMIELCLSSSPLLVTEIESAVAARDGIKIASGAHTLKGALRNMCATTCAEVAFELEKLGKANDFERADQSLATLKHEYARLQAVLNNVAKGVGV